MALIQCPHCGNPVSELAAACPKCGHPIKTASATAPKQSATPKMAKGKKSKALWLTIAGLFLAGLVAVAIIRFGGPSGEECYKRGMRYVTFNLPYDVYYKILYQNKEGDINYTVLNGLFGMANAATINNDAVRWFHRGAKKGHTECLLMEGCIYYLGYSGEQDIYKASKSFYQAAQKGSDMGKTLYAVLLSNNCLQTKYGSPEYEIYKDIYYTGDSELEEKVKTFISILQEATNNGCHHAAYYLGYFYYWDNKNYDNPIHPEANEMIKKACSNGVKDVLGVKKRILQEEEEARRSAYMQSYNSYYGW